MRSEVLWIAVKPVLRSKQSYKKTIDELENEGAIDINEKSHKFREYFITEKAFQSHKSELSLARRISKSGSIELVAEAMDILASYERNDKNTLWIFANREERMQAALDFWVENYKNLCVLNSLFSIREKDKETVKSVRKAFQATEDAYFDILLRLRDNHPGIVEKILERKLSHLGIDLNAVWVAEKLDNFLKTNYSRAHEKLTSADKQDLYSKLEEKERERELIYCKIRKKQLPRAICKTCKLLKVKGRLERRYQRDCIYSEKPPQVSRKQEFDK